MPRVADADHHGARQARPRRAGPAPLALRRGGERDREAGNRARRGRDAARGVARPRRQAAPLPLAQRHRPGDRQGRGVDRDLPGLGIAHLRADVPAGQRRRRRLGDAGRGRGGAVVRRMRQRPTRGWRRIRRQWTGRWTSRPRRWIPGIRSSPRRWRPASASASHRRLGGLDSWFDAATFTRFGETPSIGFGPRDIAWAHTIDEYVPVDDLVRCSQALALAAVDYCGVES